MLHQPGKQPTLPATPQGANALARLEPADFREAVRVWSIPQRVEAILEMSAEEAGVRIFRGR